jgi:hypothetical protein
VVTEGSRWLMVYGSTVPPVTLVPLERVVDVESSDDDDDMWNMWKYARQYASRTRNFLIRAQMISSMEIGAPLF